MAGGEEVTTSRRRKILEHAADGVPHFRTAKVRKLPEPVDKNPFRNVIKWTWQLRLQVSATTHNHSYFYRGEQNLGCTSVIDTIFFKQYLQHLQFIKKSKFG